MSPLPVNPDTSISSTKNDLGDCLTKPLKTYRDQHAPNSDLVEQVHDFELERSLTLSPDEGLHPCDK